MNVCYPEALNQVQPTQLDTLCSYNLVSEATHFSQQRSLKIFDSGYMFC